MEFSELQKPRDLDLGSGHMAYRRASLIDLNLYTKFHRNRKNIFMDGLTAATPPSQGQVTQKVGQIQLECGPMPNVMVALPNIGGALCSTPQSLADAHY